MTLHVIYDNLMDKCEKKAMVFGIISTIVFLGAAGVFAVGFLNERAVAKGKKPVLAEVMFLNVSPFEKKASSAVPMTDPMTGSVNPTDPVAPVAPVEPVAPVTEQPTVQE